MRRPFRIALVIVGLTAVVYGAASLTGGWLGTPPWWERPPTDAEAALDWYGPSGFGGHHTPWRPTMMRPRTNRELISTAVIAAGLGLAAVGAWPRRRRSAAAP